MSAEFDRKIHDTLADANLQLAVYTATGRLKDKRIQATAEGVLPDYQELRTQANAGKKHAIDNLDHYLEEFERNVEAHGGKWSTAGTPRRFRTSCWTWPSGAAPG